MMLPVFMENCHCQFAMLLNSQLLIDYPCKCLVRVLNQVPLVMLHAKTVYSVRILVFPSGLTFFASSASVTERMDALTGDI